MSPTPTDVSYRSANTMDRGSAYVANPGPLKGVREEHAVVAADARVTRMNGNTSSSSQAFSSNGTGNGAGPGNMSSGISVQELKQMTALRMAQAQGHLRVVSPFQYGVQQSQARASSPGPTSAESGRESSRVQQGIPRTSSSKSVGGSLGDNPRVRRNSISGSESNTNNSNGGNGTTSGGSISGASRGPNGADVPPNSTSSSSSGRGVGTRRRSLSPIGRGSSPPPPQPAPTGSNASSSRASPATSSLPHGLTVQELKELTKMRLAKEAFNIPVYAVLQASAQRPTSPGGPNGTAGPPGTKGAAGRGRPVSPAQGLRRRQESRSPVGGGRSTPSSPDQERVAGERPHRRTRRGGRRGRNRSPRPENQFSPSLSAGADTTTGSAGGGPDSRDGFSSASPSPRERGAHTGAWSESEDQLHPRSSSQPRSMTHDHPFVASDSRRPTAGGGTVDRGRQRDGRSSMRERASHAAGSGSASPHDIYGPGSGTIHNFGMSNGLASAAGAGASGGMPDGCSAQGPGQGRGLQMVFRAHGAHHSSHDRQWESRSRGRGSPHPPDVAWAHEIDRRRREGMNVRDFSVDHHRGGSVEPRDQERAMPPERPRSAHLERVYMSVNGVMGYDEQVHLRDGEDPRRELLLTGGSDRALLRGHDLRDAPPPPSHTRLHRAYSESVAAMGGSRGRAGDGRHQGVQHTSPGVSPHIRPRDVPSSSHHQLQSQRHTFMDQKLASSASSQGHGHGPVHHSQLNGGNRSHPMLNGDTGGGVGKGGYDYEYHGNHQGVSHQQVPSLHRGLSTPTLGSSGGSIASGNSRRGLPIHVDDPDIDHGYILDSHGLGSGGGPGSGITNNDQGGRSGSSAPSSSSFMSSRQGRTNSRSDGRGGGGGRRGGYGNGGGPSYVSDRYKSSSSPSEVYRDDISHTVAESVLVTPKTPNGPVHWQTAQGSSWQGQASSASMLQDREQNLYPTSSVSHQHNQSTSTPPFSQSPHLFGSQSRSHGDDCSTTSSNETFPSLRRDLSAPAGRVGGGTGTGSVRGMTHSQHEQQAQRQNRGEFRSGRPVAVERSMSYRLSGTDMLSTSRHDDMDVHAEALLSSSGPSSLGAGLVGHVRGNINFNRCASPRLASTCFPNSAPSTFERESFPLLPGESVGISGLRSALDASYGSKDSDARGDRDPRGMSSAGVNGEGVRKHVSPSFGASPMMENLGTSMTDDRQTPVNSPLMAGLTFSIDLAGYGASGGHQSHPVGSEGAGSSHGSDFLGFESDTGSSAPSIAKQRLERQQHDQAVIMEGMKRSDVLGGAGSTSSPVSAREESPVPFGTPNVNHTRVASLSHTSSLFSYATSHDHGQAGNRGVDEITARLEDSNLMSNIVSVGSDLTVGMMGQHGEQRQGPGAIGSSRSNSMHDSATSSPCNAGRVLTHPASSLSPEPGTTGSATEGSDAGTPATAVSGSMLALSMSTSPLGVAGKTSQVSARLTDGTDPRVNKPGSDFLNVY